MSALVNIAVIVSIILSSIAIQISRNRASTASLYKWSPSQNKLILPVAHANISINGLSFHVTPQTPIIKPPLLFGVLHDLDCANLWARGIMCQQPDRSHGPLQSLHIFHAVANSRIYALRSIQPPVPPSICIPVACQGYTLNAPASFCAILMNTTTSVPVFYGPDNSRLACSASSTTIYSSVPTCAAITAAIPVNPCPQPPPPPPPPSTTSTTTTTTTTTTTATTVTTSTTSTTSTTTTAAIRYTGFYNIVFGRTCINMVSDFWYPPQTYDRLADVYNTYSISADGPHNTQKSITYLGYLEQPVTATYTTDSTTITIQYSLPNPMAALFYYTGFIGNPSPRCITITPTIAYLISMTPVMPSASYIIWSVPDCLGFTPTNVVYSSVVFVYDGMDPSVYTIPSTLVQIAVPSFQFANQPLRSLPMFTCTPVSSDSLVGVVIVSPAISLRSSNLAFAINLHLPNNVTFTKSTDPPQINVASYSLVPFLPEGGSFLSNIQCAGYSPLNYQNVPYTQFRVPSSASFPNVDMPYLFSMASTIHPLMGPNKLSCIDMIWVSDFSVPNYATASARWAGPTGLGYGCTSPYYYDTPAIANNHYIFNNRPTFTTQVDCSTGSLVAQMSYRPSRDPFPNAAGRTITGRQVSFTPSSIPVQVYDWQALLFTTAEIEYTPTNIFGEITQPYCMTAMTSAPTTCAYDPSIGFINVGGSATNPICKWGQYEPMSGPAQYICGGNSLYNLTSLIYRAATVQTCPAVSPVYYVTYTMYPSQSAFAVSPVMHD